MKAIAFSLRGGGESSEIVLLEGTMAQTALELEDDELRDGEICQKVWAVAVPMPRIVKSGWVEWGAVNKSDVNESDGNKFIVLTPANEEDKHVEDKDSLSLKTYL